MDKLNRELFQCELNDHETLRVEHSILKGGHIYIGDANCKGEVREVGCIHCEDQGVEYETGVILTKEKAKELVKHLNKLIATI